MSTRTLQQPDCINVPAHWHWQFVLTYYLVIGCFVMNFLNDLVACDLVWIESTFKGARPLNNLWQGVSCWKGRMNMLRASIYSLRRNRLVGIRIPIINLRRSSNRIRFIMGIPIPVRRRLVSELNWNYPYWQWAVITGKERSNKT